jgi:hypothetical protein
MIAVLRSLENPNLILLVSSVGRIEVAVGASFKVIVKFSSTGLSSACVGSATGGPIVKAIKMAPRKHPVAPWKSARTVIYLRP